MLPPISVGTDAQFLGGGQVGVNYQFGNRVIGAEAMFDWLLNSQNAIITATDPAGAVAANIRMRNARWLTTLSGRLGYAWDRVLLCAKGGGAWVTTNTPRFPSRARRRASPVPATPRVQATLQGSASSGRLPAIGRYAGNTRYRTARWRRGTPTFGGDVITYNNCNTSMSRVQ